MNFPVRCFTCGMVVSKYWSEYKASVAQQEDPQTILNRLRIGRMCCRRMFLGHVDNEEMLLMYPTYPGGINRLGTKKVSKMED